MARSDLLLSLVRASGQRDQAMVLKTVQAMAAEERAKKHNVLADQLLLALEERKQEAVLSRGTPWQPTITAPLWTELTPTRTLDSLTVRPDVASACRELIEEQMRSELLRSHGLEPRHRVMLAGPPGNGKTVLAEALAEAMMLPLVSPRYEALIGSYLGETSSRVAKLFEYVRGRRCVLFLDEFETLGKERADPRDAGEMKRVVSTLLLQVDALPSYVILVVATNHAESLDRAAWRRFQIRLHLPPPSRAQAVAWIERDMKAGAWGTTKKASTIAARLSPTSFSELEEFCRDVRRTIVLRQESATADSIIASRLDQWVHRTGPTKPRR